MTQEPTFGAVLAAVLERRGMNLSDFGRLVGLSQQRISFYHRGVSKPPLELIEEWADKLKLVEGPERDALTLAAYRAHRWGGVWKRFQLMQEKLSKAATPTDADTAAKLSEAGRSIAHLAGLLHEVKTLFFSSELPPYQAIPERRKKLKAGVEKAVLEHWRPEPLVAKAGGVAS